jgi:hypothetical protein
VIEYFASNYPDDYPEPEAVVLLHRAVSRLQEVPALMRERQGGASTITLLRGIYYVVKVVLTILIDMLKPVHQPRRPQPRSRSSNA